MAKPDVRILWLNVHGGAFHKLLTLQEELDRRGIACELVIACGPPRGLKIGVDVPEALLPELAARGVRFLPRAQALELAESTPARLLVTDAHHDPDLPGLLARVAARGLRTAQMATLLGDFTCHGAQHLLLQHPLTLFFELEFSRSPEARLLAQARSLHFTGNIFFEPTLNTLTTGFADREAFCARYGFDPARPICLWMPNAADVADPDYGRVAEAAAGADMNLAVKLHPWEYAWKKHGAEGVDPWGHGRTSDEIWGVRPVAEADGTWACRFCDVAVMRGSSTCLEMPFWRKPGVLLPSAMYSGLVRAQAHMVRSCSVSLPSVAGLAGLLRGPLPAFSGADYEVGRAAVRLDTRTDAYTLTCAALEEILDMPAGPTLPRSARALRALYLPHVTPLLAASLIPKRRLRHELGRLAHALGL